MSTPDAAPAPNKALNGGCLLIAFLGLPIIAVTLFGYRMFLATEVEAEVLSHRWERIVTIETLREYNERSSCTRIPIGAVAIQEEPDPGEKGELICRYQLNRWEISDTERIDGKGLVPGPSWPQPGVTNCEQEGCTRVGARDGRYFVSLLDSDGDQHECSLDEEDWNSLKPGSKARGKKSLFLETVACRSFLR